MGVRAMTSGGLRALLRLRVMHFGALRTIRTLKVMDNGTLRLVGNFYDDVSVSVTPSSVSGQAFGGSATTGQVTATASGGLGPYFYLWTLVSNSNPGTPSPTNSTNRQTRFSGQVGGSAVFRVTATDSFGTTGAADVFATFTDLT